MNRESYEVFGDPETLTRIAQYEMAFRMQTAVPEVMDISDEPANIHQLYGTQPGKESFCQQLPPGKAPGPARRAVHPAV